MRDGQTSNQAHTMPHDSIKDVTTRMHEKEAASKSAFMQEAERRSLLRRAGGEEGLQHTGVQRIPSYMLQAGRGGGKHWSSNGGISKLDEQARTQLKDAADYLIFESSGGGAPANVLASSFQDPRPSELPAIAKSLDNRDDAIKQGLTLQGTRYEVHRHHPPLVYGRTMCETPEESVGVALCMVENTPSGTPIYGLITYKMPNISARMVPILQSFCSQHLATA